VTRIYGDGFRNFKKYGDGSATRDLRVKKNNVKNTERVRFSPGRNIAVLRAVPCCAGKEHLAKLIVGLKTTTGRVDRYTLQMLRISEIHSPVTYFVGTYRNNNNINAHAEYVYRRQSREPARVKYLHYATRVFVFLCKS